MVATDPCPIIISPEKDRKLETHRITKWQILVQSSDHTFFYGWPGLCYPGCTLAALASSAKKLRAYLSIKSNHVQIGHLDLLHWICSASRFVRVIRILFARTVAFHSSLESLFRRNRGICHIPFLMNIPLTFTDHFRSITSDLI